MLDGDETIPVIYLGDAMSGAKIIGGKKLEEALKKHLALKGMHVRVGVLEGATYPDGTKVAAIAEQNEFGGEIEVAERQQDLHFKQGKDGSVGNKFVKKSKSNFVQTVTVKAHKVVVPARPFMRRSVAQYSGIWKDGFAKLMETNPPEVALEKLGKQMVRDIQKTIKAVGAEGGNAEQTISRKGFDKPLTDSGHMGRSIDSEVVPGESE